MDKAMRKPEVVYRAGRVISVILDVEDYIRLMEQAEDAEDSEEIKKLRREKLSFRPLTDYLKEHGEKI